MPISQDQLIRSFGLAVESQNAALFVGAGLSAGAGMPSWVELLHPFGRVASIPDSLTDLPLAAQYIVSAIPGGRQALEAHVIEQLSRGGKPTLGHRVMANLPITDIWTTNYDALLEEAMPTARVVYSDADLLDRTQLSSTRIIKMHGSIDSRRSSQWRQPPVLTREDYERYHDTHPRVWAALQATYLTRSMLFLGFSFSDPNIEILLRLSRTLKSAKAGEHFTVLRRPTAGEDIKLHRHRVADLESTGVAVCEVDNHDELIPLLRGLERRSRAPAIFVSGSYVEDSPFREASRSIGSQLASTKLSVLSLGGSAAVDLSYAFGHELKATGAYSPERIRFTFAPREKPGPLMRERLGTVVYGGAEKDSLRAQVVASCRVALIIGGESGTAREAEIVRGQGVPIVPLAHTEGTARRQYESLSAAAALHDGPHAERDWSHLSAPDSHVAVAAALRLIARAAFLGKDPFGDSAK